MISSMIPSPTFHPPSSNWIQQTMEPNMMVMDSSSTHTSPSLSTSKCDYPKVVRRRKGIGNTPEEIYFRVQKPYNYVESYRYLIEYAKHRYEI